MCINIERGCRSISISFFAIFIVFLANRSSFMAPFIHSHIDFVCLCWCLCRCVCVTPGCLFANRVLQSQICVTGGPAGLQCVFSTSALLGEKLSHPLTQGNNSSTPPSLTKLPSTPFQNHTALKVSQFSPVSQQHASTLCTYAAQPTACTNIPTKYQYVVKFIGESSTREN